MTNKDFFFWIGSDGELEELEEAMFEQRQKDWDGPRPQDFEPEPDIEEEMSPLDVQEGGSHYKNWAIQPVEFSMANNLDLCQANVIKYVVRFRDKGGMEDLMKAKHYIDLLMYFEYGEDNNGQ